MRLCPEHRGQRGAASSSAEFHGAGFRLFCTQMLPCPCLLYKLSVPLITPWALERERGLSEHEEDFRLGAISKLFSGDVVPPPLLPAKQRKDPL